MIFPYKSFWTGLVCVSDTTMREMKGLSVKCWTSSTLACDSRGNVVGISLSTDSLIMSSLMLCLLSIIDNWNGELIGSSLRLGSSVVNAAVFFGTDNGDSFWFESKGENLGGVIERGVNCLEEEGIVFCFSFDSFIYDVYYYFILIIILGEVVNLDG